jgi:ATP-dependent DNA helicase PIF1
VSPMHGNESLKIPEQYLVDSTNTLIESVFPHIKEGYDDSHFVARRAILTPKNDDMDMLNTSVMDAFPGESRTYISADSVVEEGQNQIYPTEFLNTLCPSGMPPHAMTLKVGSPIMLLRNLKPGLGHGLRNGTRMIVTQLGDRVLEGEIVMGTHSGKRVLIPRIALAPSDTGLPFTLRRRQFPVRPCFAMSINKSQGQTMDFIGLYLPNPVFAHGQLYVAMSRVTTAASVKVFIEGNEGFTANIVYPEVL